MWKRLDEKYGNPAKVADVIIDGIWRTETIREGEEKRFFEFVEIIEEGYRDLKRLTLESEITKAGSVSIIEKKLLADIRRKWAETVSADNSTVDKTNKFPLLLKFLNSQRRAIEYDTASLRVPAGPFKSVIHHTTAKEEIDMKGQRLTQAKPDFFSNRKRGVQKDNPNNDSKHTITYEADDIVTSQQGYPSESYSDSGAKLVAASQELENVTKSLDSEKLKSFGGMEGFEWNFTPADAPWQKGTSESLIR
ncbi:hypothetical protein AWC38_SpisGene14299 [Stylophora pistillata]|uniref:Uncharacterized protein n=1 Tax=Stylophora pistillata TaxID=50429 RepID=A0A2B4RVM1_STYPI|nr:hypothetical protein AWC38_SpisGene14299 [Stylophora pistillata]